jgi:glycosyltransferase involved in cell wall biosynthesis
MRILQVCPGTYHPASAGAAVRANNLAIELARRHEVRRFYQVTPRLPPRSSKPLPFPCLAHRNPVARLVTGFGHRSWPSAAIPSGLALALTRPASLRSLLGWADVTIVEFPWQLGFCAAQRPPGPLVLDAHNVERRKFESWARATGAGLLRRPWLDVIERSERRAVRRADLVLVVAAQEGAELAARYGADEQRIVEIPNGADTTRLRPAGARTRRRRKLELGLGERPVVLFMGQDQPANRAGLAWVARLARLATRFTFVVVGRVGRHSVERNVVVTGLVEDVAPYLEAADLAICPIEHGAGTKIKLLESLAAGLPAVAFSESIDRTDLVHGEHLLVADKSVEGLMAALDRLADDPATAERLAAAGRRLVAERYDWGRSAKALETALERLLDPDPARRHAAERGGERRPRSPALADGTLEG